MRTYDLVIDAQQSKPMMNFGVDNKRKDRLEFPSAWNQRDMTCTDNDGIGGMTAKSSLAKWLHRNYKSTSQEPYPSPIDHL